MQIVGIKGQDLKEVERILQMYVTNTNTMHIVDETQYWFGILSMMTPALWYVMFYGNALIVIANISQVKCKHLLRIQIIIERNMSSLCGSLPFIDHGAQMRMNNIT